MAYRLCSVVREVERHLLYSVRQNSLTQRVSDDFCVFSRLTKSPETLFQRSNHIQTATRKLSTEKLLSDWRVICEKLPKGFEKYFNKDKSAPPPGSSSSGGDASSKPQATAQSSSSKPNASQSEKSAPPKSNDWSFGMFSPSNTKSGRSSGSGGGSGGSGKPLGGEGGDKEKWLMFGAVSALAIAGAIVYFEMGYKEIGWKEFVNK